MDDGMVKLADTRVLSSSSRFYFCWFKISPMGLLNGPPISQASFSRCQTNFICRYDGIGRHSRLKICLEQSSTGSSPVSGTTPSQISFDLRRFFYSLGVPQPEAIQRWLPQMPLCFPHPSGRIYRQLSLCCYDQATPGFASD